MCPGHGVPGVRRQGAGGSQANRRNLACLIVISSPSRCLVTRIAIIYGNYYISNPPEALICGH